MTRPEDSQRIANLVFYSVVLLVAVLAYRIVEPFLVEIGWAVVLAICLLPRCSSAWRAGSVRRAARASSRCSSCC